MKTTILTTILVGLCLLIPGSAAAKDIIETADKAGAFKTLTQAIEAAGLIDTLKGEGPFTVFAPTDAAFAKIPKKKLKALLRPENKDELISILTYHVVPGKIRGRDAVAARRANTVQGSRLQFSIVDGRLKVNDIPVVKTDIETDNGVIHVIDQVLLPEKKTARSNAEGAKRIIELAISRGVPFFNQGDAAACAAIYEVAVEGLLALNDGALSPAQKKRLRRAQKRAGRTHDARRQAWKYREALNDVYDGMTRMARLSRP